MKQVISIGLLIGILAFPDFLKAQKKVPHPEGTKLSAIIGLMHSNGKYRFTSDNFLKEGVDEIENMGTQVIKLFFGRATKNSYPSYWGCDWETHDFTNLTELAQTPYFQDAFGRSGLKTYILTAHELSNGGNVTNFKNGISMAERNNLYTEIYDLTTYLYNTYSGTGKTFVLANWEGDGMLGFVNREGNLPPPDTAHMWLSGFIDWLNIRQDAITDARNDAINAGKTDVLVAGAAECNHVSIQKEYDWPTMVDSVIPYTRMDLYSFSNWKTNKLSTVDDFNETLSYIKDKAPDSELFGEDNLYLGEIGTFELVNLVGNIPAHTSESDRIAREVMQRNIEYALKFGIRYIVHWQIFCNGLRSGVTLPPGQNAVQSQLTGTGIRRANGSYSGTYNYYKSIMEKTIGEYINVYEAEAQTTTTSAGASNADVRFNAASGEYFSKLTASVIGDWIQYDLHVSQTEACRINVKVRKGPSYGQFKLAVGDVVIDTIVDCYNNGSNIFAEIDMGTITLDSAGIYPFKFMVEGKSGSTFNLGIDAITITPVNRSPQTIIFNPLESRSVVDQPFVLDGASSEGLPLQYQSSNPEVASITSNGGISVVTILGPGTTTITARQEGNSMIDNAEPVQRTLLVMDSSGLIQTEVIVDNVDAGFTTGGSWSISGSSLDKYGVNYAFDGTTGSDVGKWAKWTPDILATGCFNIEMMWNGGSSRPRFAPVEIQRFDGRDSLEVDQQLNGGKWNSIGRYRLEAGLSNYVKIHASSPGYTIADAVKFVLKKLAVPADLTVTDSTATSVNAKWKSVYGATGYYIYVSTSEGGPYNKHTMSMVTDTTIYLENASPHLYFRVSAVSAYGESNLSEFASAFPKSDQTITFNSLAPVNEDISPFQLTAVATSMLPIAYTSSDTAVADVFGNIVVVKKPGSITIRASQAGNENYLVAADVSQPLTINPMDSMFDLQGPSHTNDFEVGFPATMGKAVSPNGDGINEYLDIEAVAGFPDNRVQVFNRNGMAIYEAKGYNNATVAFRGVGIGSQRVPAGTYYYIAEINIDGELSFEKGWFVLRY